jgi:HlyD family secretion protein
MADDLHNDLMSLKIDRDAPRSRGGSGVGKVLIWLLVLGGLGVGGVALKPYLEAQVFKTTVSATQISRVSPAQAAIDLTASGYVQADISSRVAPKLAGRVAAVKVRQGQRVEAGQVLLELDPADEQANVQTAQSQANAALAQSQSAKARGAVAEAQLQEALVQANRERKLADQRVVGFAAAEDLEARVASLRQAVAAAQAEAKASGAQAAALQAQVSALKTQMGNLTLVAPISGTIVNRPPQIGEFLGPQPPGLTVDMGGIRIADFTTLLVETDIPEGRLGQVKVGGPAEIILDAYPDRRYRGSVREITPQVDRAKATVVVKVAFVEGAEGVLPDMSARVSFLGKELDAAALQVPPKNIVPGSAIVERGGAKVVFVIEDGKARMKPITVGSAFGSGFELTSGPAPGTQIVNNPPDTLADGQGLKVTD